MDNNKVSDMIRNIRKNNNLTQKEFADSLNVTFQAVSKWENGKNIPDIETLKLICNKYNIDINTLLNNNNVPKKKNYKYLFIIIIVVLILINIILILSSRKSDFTSTTISGTCDAFNISGVLTYSSDKTSIIINSISYCGSSVDIYSDFEALIYAERENTEVLIGKMNVEGENTLDNFTKGLTFKIDSEIKSLIDNSNLKLIIRAKNSNNEQVNYEIPITLESKGN